MARQADFLRAGVSENQLPEVPGRMITTGVFFKNRDPTSLLKPLLYI